MIVRANNRDYTVRDGWRHWPMWVAHTPENKSLGYIRAVDETEAISLAIAKYNTMEVIVYPFDGVL